MNILLLNLLCVLPLLLLKSISVVRPVQLKSTSYLAEETMLSTFLCACYFIKASLLEWSNKDCTFLFIVRVS